MDPCTCQVRLVGLCRLMRALPVAVPVVPQRLQRGRNCSRLALQKVFHAGWMQRRKITCVTEPLSPLQRTALLRVTGLTKTYPGTGAAAAPLTLFSGLDLEVASGEMIAVVGESGAGKSTLLHLLAAMDTPTSGSVNIDGTTLSNLSATQQAEFRNRTIGYVWQAHYLLPEFTAVENVAMPLLARGEKPRLARDQALRCLAQVELADRAEHRAGELSGGEQQRVSLARALVAAPRLLLADEPTGNLDSRTGEVVFSLLQRLHREHRMTTVLVTHHLAFAQRCDRVLRLHSRHAHSGISGCPKTGSISPGPIE